MRRDKVKVSFRLLSPNPSALDYRPGHTYYFICEFLNGFGRNSCSSTLRLNGFAATSTGTRRGLENRHGGLCASHQLKMVIHVTDKNGDISNHRIHRKPTTTTTTTTTKAPSDVRWPSDPLWGEFFEKVERGENPIWPTVTRGERVSLDGGSRRHEYEALTLEDQVDFQIHEIGDVESLFSSGPPPLSPITVAVILLTTTLLTL
ncbi:hypothetical protein ANCCAN_29106 [Ancylostoma caninum]|uniref:Ephrin RBD domain-containing protein n=1 Tax=Ancylostoma caninum TaxID=29170 RepID=A0A368EZG8_ANCCA|nr:hypothetical protein ANCCAN_29106 [Ancylostoma caninum]